MNRSSYVYTCQSCAHRFEVVAVSRDQPEPQGDDVAESQGYPEEQLACPICHSHDAVHATTNDVSDDSNLAPHHEE